MWSLRVALLVAIAAVVLGPRPAAAAGGFPEFSAPVVDEAGVVPDDVEAALNQALSDYQDQSGNQIAVAVVDTTGARTIEGYSRSLFNRWRVGQKDKDNGVLLVIAYNDHRLRIQVGLGLESRLTNDRAATIIDDDITPLLRADDVGGAITAGVSSIASVLGDGEITLPDDFSGGAPIGEPVRVPEPSSSDGSSGRGVIGLIVVVIIILIIVGIVTGGRRRSGWSRPVVFGNNDPWWNNDYGNRKSGWFGNWLRSGNNDSGWSSGSSGSSFGGSSSDSGGGGGSFSGGGGGSTGGGGASGSW
jgi:uncharacterized protein